MAEQPVAEVGILQPLSLANCLPGNFESSLRLILRNPTVSYTIYSQRNAFVRLSCVSKGTKNAIEEHKPDTAVLDVCMRVRTREAAEQFAKWFAHNRGKVKTIELFQLPERSSHDFLAAEIAIAGAMLYAAAADNMQLQAFKSKDPSCAVLQQIPANHLTCLELTAHLLKGSYLDGVSMTLRRLTGLKSLSLSAYTGDALTGVEPLVPYLAAFQHLTYLHLDPLCSLALPRGRGPLPGQLKVLHLKFNECARQQSSNAGLSLGHLSALTELDLERDFTGHLSLAQHDILPSKSLQVLRIQGCDSVTPLLHLQQLQRLELNAAQLPLLEVLQLSVLTGLTALKASFPHGQGVVTQCFGGWHLMTGIRDLQLEIGGNIAPSAVASQLQLHTGLTRLALHSATEWDDPPVMLSAALRQLQGLRELELKFPAGAFCYYGPTANLAQGSSHIHYGTCLSGMGLLLEALADIKVLKRVVFRHLSFRTDPFHDEGDKDAAAYFKQQVARCQPGSNVEFDVEYG